MADNGSILVQPVNSARSGEPSFGIERLLLEKLPEEYSALRRRIASELAKPN
jgi:hypothetical protein